MERAVDTHLRAWKDDDRRKVLLVRGARQVGKTYAVRRLGATYPHFLEVNLEESREIHSFFGGSLDPSGLGEKLANYFGVPLHPEETLLFLDEIQACPDALRALRFFQEKTPGLHVVAAGSLLEFALAKIPSHGVGRITSFFMYPMHLAEFLGALGEAGLWELLRRGSPRAPLEPAIHQRLLDRLKTYLLIGGMPAVVAAWVETRDARACQDVLDDLFVTFRDDFAKYQEHVPASRLQDVFESVVYQAGGKFKYSNVAQNADSRAVKTALALLVQAGLATKIRHSDARGLPLGAQVNPKRFKMMLLDVGLHQRVLGLDLREFLRSSRLEIVNRGSLAELFVGQELRAHAPPRQSRDLYYWHREARASNAEVDYVVDRGGRIVPLEVKSGGRGSMQSMRLFLRERGLPRGIRLSLENFATLGEIDIVPLYAAGMLVDSPSAR